jgi:hypothetical protein
MLTAKARSSQAGKPLPDELQVPRYARGTFNHKIYWSAKSQDSAGAYNYICEAWGEKPCLRRWLEFINGDTEDSFRYLTFYAPDTIRSNPERVWVVYEGGEPVCSFTNAMEAWFIILGGKHFGNKFDYTIHYIDRTV